MPDSPSSSWGSSNTFGCTRSRVCCLNPVIPHGQCIKLGTTLPDNGGDRLRKTEVGVLQERELKEVVLANRHQN